MSEKIHRAMTYRDTVKPGGMKASRTIVVAAALLVCFAKEARVSQIFFESVDAAEIASRAPYIVRAVFRSDVDPQDPHSGRLFEVTEVLRAPAGHKFRGKSSEIHVWQRAEEAWGTAIYMAATSGVRRSPLVFQMAGDALELGKNYILFLHRGVKDGEFVFEAQDAHLTPESYEQLRLRARKANLPQPSR